MNWLSRTQCVKCGGSLDGRHTRPPFISPDELGLKLYEHTELRFIKAVCSCGEEYTCTLKPQGHNFLISDIAYADEASRAKSDAEEEAIVPQTLSDDKPNLEEMDRNELLGYAKEIGVKGRTQLMNTDVLKQKINELLS